MVTTVLFLFDFPHILDNLDFSSLVEKLRFNSNETSMLHLNANLNMKRVVNEEFGTHTEKKL